MHTIGDIWSIRVRYCRTERQLLTIQKVPQCARPEHTTIHIRRELGQDANQGVEGEAWDLEEVRLSDHQRLRYKYHPSRTTYIWGTDEVE